MRRVLPAVLGAVLGAAAIAAGPPPRVKRGAALPAGTTALPMRAAITAAALALAPATAQARGTVVLTYDDALPSQLDHALPALDAAGLKATFFLSTVHAADVTRTPAPTSVDVQGGDPA